VPVLFLIAIVVVLVGIFFAATGRGGEMAYEPADHAPLDLGPVSAADIALLRPPTAMWGYNMQVTDEALDQIARAVRERDITIAYLQEQVAGYEGHGSYTEPLDAYARQDPEISAAETYGIRETPEIAEPFDPEPSAVAATVPRMFGLAELFESRDTPETFSDSPETTGASPETPGASPEAFSASPETPGASREAFSASPETPGASPGPAGALEPHDALESHEPRQSPEDPEASHSSAPGESLDTPGPVEPQEPSEPPEPLGAAEPAAAAAATAAQAPEPPRTPLVLKASAPKPEPHEATQPSQTLPDPGDVHDATEPSAVLRDDEESGEATQPSATVAPDEPKGPQGAFDTHGWWAEQAEQQEAARHDQPRRQASAEQEGDSMAAAEEQGR
jgi:hypothetical protein